MKLTWSEKRMVGKGRPCSDAGKQRSTTACQQLHKCRHVRVISPDILKTPWRASLDTALWASCVPHWSRVWLTHTQRDFVCMKYYIHLYPHSVYDTCVCIGLLNLYVLSSYESTVCTYINGHHDLFTIASCTYKGYTDLGLTTHMHIFSVIIVMYTCSPINPTIHSTCFCIHHMHASIMNLYNLCKYMYWYIYVYRVCCMVHCQVVTACMNYL